MEDSRDGRCAGRHINTEHPDNKLNCCTSACRTVLNAIYLRQFVAVRVLTVNSYAVSLTRPNSP